MKRLYLVAVACLVGVTMSGLHAQQLDDRVIANVPFPPTSRRPSRRRWVMARRSSSGQRGSSIAIQLVACVESRR